MFRRPGDVSLLGEHESEVAVCACVLGIDLQRRFKFLPRLVRPLQTSISHTGKVMRFVVSRVEPDGGVQMNQPVCRATRHQQSEAQFAVSARVVRIAPEQSLVGQNAILEEARLERLVHGLQIVLTLHHDLQPQLGHLVGGL